MEKSNNDARNVHTTGSEKKALDLEPGLENRNLLSDTHDEAPIDKDLPMAVNNETEAGDETYEDEEMNDPDYFEKRAGDNVRK